MIYPSATAWIDFPGDDGDRTRNLRLAKPSLSQLSYIPVIQQWTQQNGRTWARTRDLSFIRAAL